MSRAELSEEMLDELREAVEIIEYPEGAMTFAQILDAFGGKGEYHLRKTVQRFVKEGRWKMARFGQKYYYWKVEN